MLHLPTAQSHSRIAKLEEPKTLHEPAAPTGRDPAFLYKRRLDVLYFLIYSVVYVGFVVINLVSPTFMGFLSSAV